MAEKKSGFMDTRGAFIDAAFALMSERSFEDTSVDVIVARAKLSKGTFFHYFRTKDALIEAACERLAQQGWQAVEPTLKGEGSPIEKLAGYLSQGRRFRVKHAAEVGEVWDGLAKEHNATLRARVSKAYRELVRPHFRELIAQGAAAGQFQVEDAATTTDLLLEFVEASAEGSMRLLRSGSPDAAELASRRVNATMTAVERILGVEKGVLLRTCAQTLERFQKPTTEGGA
ncbi:MAG: TetR/AcrR family transcriptional regulator [Myxococcales bacterium]